MSREKESKRTPQRQTGVAPRVCVGGRYWRGSMLVTGAEEAGEVVI